MAESRFNLSPDVWDRAVDEVFEILAATARRGATISYGDVVAQMHTVRLEPDSHAFHHMLADVSARAFDTGAPLLSAVVVHRDDRRPGSGFCALARRLGFEVGEDRIDEEVFWANQLEAVHAWWRRR